LRHRRLLCKSENPVGGIDETADQLPHLIEPEKDPLFHYVPTTMAAGDGVRLSIAFHAKPEGARPARAIVSFDTFGDAADRFDYVEGDTFEIVKVLRKEREETAVPEALGRLAFEDMSANLGMVMHSGKGASVAARKTLLAVVRLCKAWTTRCDDRLVSFNIGIEFDDRDFYLSIAGHVVDLAKFLDALGASLPATAPEVPEWVERAYRILNELFPPSGDSPPLGRMLQHTGILLFDRKMVERELYDIQYDEGRGGLFIKYKIPRTNEVLCELLRSGKIVSTGLFQVIRSRCMKCKKEYLSCDCSKYLDEGAGQLMEEAPLCGAFWTNRSANLPPS
jgi:hypothetical protein